MLSKTLTQKEALALREFLTGIQSVDPTSEVAGMIEDIELYLELDERAKAIASARNLGSSPDLEQGWNQIFDLGEALAKLPSSRQELLDAIGQAQREEIASKSHLDHF